MTIARYAFVRGAIVGLMLGGVAAGVAQAENKADHAVYKPAESISYNFGSTHAVGYFSQQNGVCALTMFVTENAADDETIPPATLVKFAVKPGDKADLRSVEGQAIEIKCGMDASTMEVRPGRVQAAYVTPDR